MRIIKKKYLKYIFINIFIFIIILLLFGIPTALIPNPIFTRMNISLIDYIFLFIISGLSSSYLSSSIYQKNKYKSDIKTSFFGGILLGIFSFTCPLCSVLLVSIFGVGFITAYFDTFRPILGVIAIIFLSWLLYNKVRNPCIKCKRGSIK